MVKGKKTILGAILCTLMALCLAVGIFSGISTSKTVYALGTEEHNHTGWTGITELPTEAGDYYLTDNITLIETWTVPTGTTNLCLNGYVIKFAGETGSVIEIPKEQNATLNLYDCDTTTKYYFSKDATTGLWTLAEDQTTPTDYYVTGGIITGGNAQQGAGIRVYVNNTFNMYGGTIIGNASQNMGGGVNNGGTFTMFGGTICGNTALSGGGVYQGRTFKMTGGVITENTATKNGGGGVLIGSDNTTLGGTAQITGNKFNGADNNVHSYGKTITPGTDNDAPTTMNVGITLNAGTGKFTVDGTANYSANFFADSDSYKVCFNNNGTDDVTTDDYLELKNLTIADILPEDFPTSEANAWVNENGKKVYVSDQYSCLVFEGLNPSLGNDCVKNTDGNYVYSSPDYTVTFVMKEDKLTQIIFDSEEHSDLNGTYQPAPAPVETSIGIIFDDGSTISGVKNELQTEFLEYSVEATLSAGDMFQLYDFGSKSSWTEGNIDEASTANIAINSNNVYEALAAGNYTIYIRMYGPENNQIYFDYTAPAPVVNVAEIDCPTCGGDGLAKCPECYGMGCDSCGRMGNVPCTDCDQTGKTLFTTLEDAISEVEYYGTITLLKDNSEEIEISKEAVFIIDKATFTFDKSKITAGTGYEISTSENGTETAFIVTTQKTIADILKTVDFPTTAETAWKNENGEKIYCSGNFLKTIFDTNIALSLTKVDENKFSYDGGVALYEFILENNKLTSIVISNVQSTLYNSYGGTYKAPAPTYWALFYAINGIVNQEEITDITEGTPYSVDGNKITIGETEIIATANQGYKFVSWYDGVKDVTENGTITENMTIMAMFEKIWGEWQDFGIMRYTFNSYFTGNGRYYVQMRSDELGNKQFKVLGWAAGGFTEEGIDLVIDVDSNNDCVIEQQELGFDIWVSDMYSSLQFEYTPSVYDPTTKEFTLSVLYSDGVYGEAGIETLVFCREVTNNVPESKTAENHGYITVRSNGYNEEVLDVYVVPAEGYQLKSGSLKVTYNDGEQDQTIIPTATETEGQYTFTMPAFAVTITAEFEEKAITIVDILPDDFPETKEDGWTNGNNSYIYSNSNTFYVDFGEGKFTLDKKTALKKSGNDYTYEYDQLTHFTFTITGEKMSSFSISCYNSASFYGTYKPVVKYDVTFHSDVQGWTDETISETFGGKFVLPAKSPIKEGHEFAGWFTAETEGTQVTAETTVEITESTTLYAQFTPIVYNTTFSANGGTWAEEKTEVKVDETYGTKFILPEINPERKGYTFAGWLDKRTKTAITADTDVFGGAKVIAQWTANVYETTFVGNFEGSTYSEKVNETYDAKYILPEINPERKDYVFTGWFTAETEGTQVTAETTVEITGSTTLYAHWEKHVHSFTYSGMLNVMTATCSKDDGVCTLPDCKLTLTLIAPESLVYDGNPKAFNFADGEATAWTGAGLELPIIDYTKWNGDSYVSYSGTPTEAGSYFAHIYVGGDGANAFAMFNITQIEVEKPQEDTTVFTYNGDSQTYNVAENDLYTVSGNVQTSAGNYSVTVSLNDKVNYKWKDGDSEDLTYSFVIAQAAGIITVDTTTIIKTYGEAVTLPIAISNFGTVSCDTVATDLVNANTYTVTYTLSETVNYTGDVKQLTVVINKITVNKPTKDTTNFVYNGEAQTYTVEASDYYTVENNVQTSAGKYTVTVSLKDKDNYEWADGTIDDLTFNFVINKKATDIQIKDENEQVIENSPVSIIDAENGINPDAILVVKVVNVKDTEETDSVEKALIDSQKIAENEKIFAVYDVKLLINDIEVQPDGKLTVKMLIPQELRGKEFRLYHVHAGSEIYEIYEYSTIDAEGYVTFEIDKLSEFAFVADKNVNSLSAGAIVGIVLGSVVFVILVVYALGYFFLYRKGKLDDKNIKVIYKFLPKAK